MKRLDGKVALVTGAANGMGEATTRLFIEEGARVVLGDIDSARGNDLVRELGSASHFVKLDVTSADDWRAAVAAAEATFGGLDILVNNAGAYATTSLQDSTEEEFERIVNVNQRGVYLGMKTAAPALARSGKGAIVNISSSAGLRGGPAMLTYRAAKWAVRGLSRSAAHDLGNDGIRVNSILPGGIRTAMIAGHSDATNDAIAQRTILKRLGEAREVAQATLFLASDDASYITGTELIVDGGVNA